MDNKKLCNNIEMLAHDTQECIRMMRPLIRIFRFDEENAEAINDFVNLLQIKSCRLMMPRDINDINDTIKRKKVYYEWNINDTG